MDNHVFITRLRLSDNARGALRRLIKDPAASDKFIRTAESAVESYFAMRRLSSSARRDHQRARRQLARLQNTDQRHGSLLRKLSPDAEHMLRQGATLAGADAGIDGAARAYLAATKPSRNGRPLDGKGIILIKTLADAFEAAGEVVRTNEDSKFVRAVEMIGKDLGIRIADMRFKVRSALSTR